MKTEFLLETLEILKPALPPLGEKVLRFKDGTVSAQGASLAVSIRLDADFEATVPAERFIRAIRNVGPSSIALAFADGGIEFRAGDIAGRIPCSDFDDSHSQLVDLWAPGIAWHDCSPDLPEALCAVAATASKNMCLGDLVGIHVSGEWAGASNQYTLSRYRLSSALPFHVVLPNEATSVLEKLERERLNAIGRISFGAALTELGNALCQEKKTAGIAEELSAMPVLDFGAARVAWCEIQGGNRVSEINQTFEAGKDERYLRLDEDLSSAVARLIYVTDDGIVTPQDQRLTVIIGRETIILRCESDQNGYVEKRCTVVKGRRPVAEAAFKVDPSEFMRAAKDAEYMKVIRVHPASCCQTPYFEGETLERLRTLIPTEYLFYFRSRNGCEHVVRAKKLTVISTGRCPMKSKPKHQLTVVRANPNADFDIDRHYRERKAKYQHHPHPDELYEILDEIDMIGRGMKRWVFYLGRALSDTKRYLGHGEFTTWIEEHCEFSFQSAWTYRNIYEQCLGREELVESLPLSILGKLCSPGCPEEIREYIFGSIHHGVDFKTDNKTFDDIIRRYKTRRLEMDSPEIKGLIAYWHEEDESKAYLNDLKSALTSLKRLSQAVTDRIKHDRPRWPVMSGEADTWLTARENELIEVHIQGMVDAANACRPISQIVEEERRLPEYRALHEAASQGPVLLLVSGECCG